MGNSRRAALVALAISIVALIASAALTVARIITPSSGSGTVPTHGFLPEGIAVATLPDVTTPLETGDVVVAMDGRSSASWADAWPDAGRGFGSVGDVIPFEVIRDGRTEALDVSLVSYPTIPMLVGSLGTLAFVSAMVVMAAFVFWRRPYVPAAGALLIAAAGAVGSTYPFLLGIDPLDLTDGLLTWTLFGTGAIYLLLWGGLIDFMLVFPRPFTRVAARPAYRIIPYAVVIATSWASVLGAWVSKPTTPASFGSVAWSFLLPAMIAFVALPVLLAIRWRRSPQEDRPLLRAFGAVLGFILVVDLIIWVIPEAWATRRSCRGRSRRSSGLPFPILIAVLDPPPPGVRPRRRRPSLGRLRRADGHRRHLRGCGRAPRGGSRVGERVRDLAPRDRDGSARRAADPGRPPSCRDSPHLRRSRRAGAGDPAAGRPARAERRPGVDAASRRRYGRAMRSACRTSGSSSARDRTAASPPSAGCGRRTSSSGRSRSSRSRSAGCSSRRAARPTRCRSPIFGCSTISPGRSGSPPMPRS